jgi:hypothetical protein
MPDLSTPQPIVDMSVLRDLSTPPAQPDLSQPPTLGGHSGNSVMSGGVTAKSEHYKIIMHTGQAPGGNGTAASTNNKLRTGLSGATQGK